MALVFRSGPLHPTRMSVDLEDLMTDSDWRDTPPYEEGCVGHTVSRLAEVRLAQRSEADSLLIDLIQKASPFGEDADGFITNYVLPVGPVHRALGYLKEHGLPTVLSPQDPS